MTIQEIAEAISSHQFEKAFPSFSDDIVWEMINGETIIGIENVRQTCQDAMKYLATVTTTFLKMKTYISENAIIIESSATYTEKNGDVAKISSCDVYEFVNQKLTRITSYNIEVMDESGKQYDDVSHSN